MIKRMCRAIFNRFFTGTDLQRGWALHIVQQQKVVEAELVSDAAQIWSGGQYNLGTWLTSLVLDDLVRNGLLIKDGPRYLVTNKGNAVDTSHWPEEAMASLSN